AEALTTQGITVSQDAIVAAEEFVIGRYAQLMRDEGHSADLVAAVLPSATRPADADAKIRDLEVLTGDAGWRVVVEAVVRINRIVPTGTPVGFDAAVLVDDAEKDLAQIISGREPGLSVSGFAKSAQELVKPIARFFDETLVMAKDPSLRAARLGLLATVQSLAPAGLDWVAIDAATK
ncbi:MAG: glycine--tRNA ligase subunit alpha/beta, partial [Propionibacterium sp.]|nr:glycine--tRNA ligase subunit alpha/beta [Propionibacterium sp.]